jgi:hypothetical protein
MVSMHAPAPHRPLVMAQFNDGADSFLLPVGATFAELADRITGLGARHAGDPVAIHIRFGKTASLPKSRMARIARTYV